MLFPLYGIRRKTAIGEQKEKMQKNAEGGLLNQEIKNTIETTTDIGAQYDACAKRILGQKIIMRLEMVDMFFFTAGNIAMSDMART